MKELTRLEAIELTEELWKILCEEGCLKSECVEFWKKYGNMEADCPLCEYTTQQNLITGRYFCASCPYRQKFGLCKVSTSPYYKWFSVSNKLYRKYWAEECLAQVRELKEDELKELG